MNDRGMTLVEIVISLVVLTVSVTAIAEMVRMSSQLLNRSKVRITENQVMDQIFDNVRAAIGQRQVNFDSSRSTDLMLESNLPMVWGNSYAGEPQGCPQCTGRYGYIAEHVAGALGLLRVTIRMTHPDWAEPKELRFITTVVQ